MRSRITTGKRPFKAAAVAAWLCLGAASAALAYEIGGGVREVSPRKPVNISASQLTYDRLLGLTIFKGSVRAVHDKVTLKADVMRALSDNREASAEGHVRVLDPSQAMTLTCGNLEYQDLMDTMTAHDHPRLTALDEKGLPVTVLGRQMQLNSEKKTVVIHQNVQILHPKGRAEAQLAQFIAGQDELVLEEGPKVVTDNAVLSGRRIVTTLGQDKSILVEGMADAVFNPSGKVEGGASVGRGPTAPAGREEGSPERTPLPLSTATPETQGGGGDPGTQGTVPDNGRFKW